MRKAIVNTLLPCIILMLGCGRDLEGVGENTTQNVESEDLNDNFSVDPIGKGQCCWAMCSNDKVKWTPWEKLGRPDHGDCGDRALGYCTALKFRYFDKKWFRCG